MPSPIDALTKAVATQRRAKAAADDALEAVRQAIREARAAGVTQTEITRITGYTREHIRQITK